MKIAIAGFGLEGRSNYTHFSREFPGAEFIIADERPVLDNVPEAATTITGSGAFEQLTDCDLVVRSAGVAPRKITTNGKIWSATNEFFVECPAEIIGVTGTKGKGTTCSLIASILRAAGKTVHLVGNIGTPALDVLPEISENDIVVYELSSFQLWDLEKSPYVAVVLMIEPDHLDVHADLDEYIAAKSNIAAHQNSQDTVIYHWQNEFSRHIAEQGGGQKQRYGVSEDGGAFVQDDVFFVQKNAICSVSTLHIAGVHNQENACAAISTALAVAPELTSEQIADGLAAFTGLPHRLKFVREVDGVRYYDDSIATTPGSAIAALRAFTEPKIIVLGGSDKGVDYGDIISEAKNQNARVIAIGQTGQKIYELCQHQGVPVEREEGLMSEVVAAAARMANPGDIVILSPASASFDQYKSYSDRGDQFIAAVQLLPNNN